MIRYTNSLFISIAIHSITVVLIVLVWQYYSSTKIIEQEKKVHIKLLNITPSPQIIKPHIQPLPKEQEKKTEEPKEIIKSNPVEKVKIEEVKKISEPKIVEKIKKTQEIKKISKPKPVEKIEKVQEIKETPKVKLIKKVQEQKPKAKIKPKKTVKKYDLEPKKIFDFAIEEVPAELVFLNKKPTRKIILQEPKEVKKKVIKKRVEKRIIQKQKIVKNKIVKKKVEQKSKKIEATRTLQKTKVTKVSKQTESSKNYLKVNTKEISKLIEDNLYYPRSARKRKITGQVKIKFKLGLNSRVYDMKIVESSHEVLSRAAMKTLMDSSGKFPKPQKELMIIIPIDYKLK